VTRVQAIRGATTLDADTREQMLQRVPQMLVELFTRNGLVDDDVISIFFTVTSDLHCMFPPGAAREVLGLQDVPMMGAVEMDVDGSLAKCVRVIVHISTSRARRELRHVYLHGAELLRPDLTDG
jgi:chorismate mutase